MELESSSWQHRRSVGELRSIEEASAGCNLVGEGNFSTRGAHNSSIISTEAYRTSPTNQNIERSCQGKQISPRGNVVYKTSISITHCTVDVGYLTASILKITLTQYTASPGMYYNYTLGLYDSTNCCRCPSLSLTRIYDTGTSKIRNA